MDLDKIEQFRKKEAAKKEKLAQEAAEEQRIARLAGSVSQTGRMTTLASQKAAKDTANKVSETVEKSSSKVAETVAGSGQKIIDAMKESQDAVAAGLNNLVLATVVSKDPQLIDTAKNLASLLAQIAKAGDDFKGSKLNLLPIANEKLAQSIEKLANKVNDEPDKDYSPDLERIRKQLEKINVQPIVNVPETKLDVSAVTNAVKELQKELSKQKAPSVVIDMKPVIAGLEKVSSTVNSLSFPVPNYILPFKDPTTGKATQVTLTASGEIPTSGGGGSSTPTTVYSGNKNVTTAGTQVALASSTTVKSVTIKAKTGNTGSIYVGDSNVSSSDGFVLAAGEAISMDIANLSTVYIDSSVNGEGVTYIAVN